MLIGKPLSFINIKNRIYTDKYPCMFSMVKQAKIDKSSKTEWLKNNIDNESFLI